MQDNIGDTPPFTHNIARLLADTQLVLAPAQAKFVQQLNTFQLEGRYESYTPTCASKLPKPSPKRCYKT
ncbi:MAG: hypothetical protein WKG07_18415 [Hymenobacter sp.]